VTTSSSNGAKPPSPYARFIPREELGSFAAWSPGSLEAEPPPAAEAAPAADTAAVQVQVAAARQSGYQDGYRDGLAALDSFKRSFAQQMTAQIGRLVAGFDAELSALEPQMAQALGEAALSLARGIVRAELHTRPEIVAEAAQQALAAVLLSARHIQVRVHPEDLPLVQSGAADALAARGARLQADAAVGRGGCRIESDLGRIDATLEARWRQAAALFGSERPWADEAGDSAPPAAAAGDGR
jgi:flagellar assembly protein FliH